MIFFNKKFVVCVKKIINHYLRSWFIGHCPVKPFVKIG